MITLSWFQDPPLGLGASASTVNGPPDAATFFRWPSAKKPRNFASADQKGNEAPSVPSSFLAARSLKECTQIESFSFGPQAQNATAVPPPRKFDQTSPASSAATTAAHSRRSRNRRRRLPGGAVLMLEPPLAIQRNSRAMSAAFCQRDSGSFSRQSWTT